jgi:predicted transcriptional regulator
MSVCRDIMLKGEIEILSSIALNKCKMRHIINSRIARDNMYVITAFDSMIKDGFIHENKANEYRLTLKSIRALLQFSNNRELSRKILHSKSIYQTNDKSTLTNKE